MIGLEADPSVKVVVFQSANPDFFVSHLDTAEAAEPPEALGLWLGHVTKRDRDVSTNDEGLTRGWLPSLRKRKETKASSRMNCLGVRVLLVEL